MEGSYSARDIALIKTVCSTTEELAKQGVPHNQILDKVAVRLNHKSFRHLAARSKAVQQAPTAPQGEHIDFSLVFDCTEWPIYPGPLTTFRVEARLMRWLEENQTKDGRDVTSEPLHAMELENTDGCVQKRLRIFDGNCFAVFELLSKEGKVTQEMFGQKGVPINSLITISRGTLALRELFSLRLIPRGNSVKEMEASRTFLLSDEDGPGWLDLDAWYPLCEASEFSSTIFNAHEKDEVGCFLALLSRAASSLLDKKTIKLISEEDKASELLRYGVDRQNADTFVALDAFIKKINAGW